MSARSLTEAAAEFDAYADAYAAGMDSPLKAMLGKSAEDFIAVKAEWLARRFPELPRDAGISLLDYGCGAGALLRVLRAHGWRVALYGSDVSEGMIETARAQWPPLAGPIPTMRLQDGARTPWDAGVFDLVVLSSVLHHVPLPERDPVIAEVRRVLRPGGHVVMFEHNPRNPVTRHVVARTPIDRNALLVDEREAQRLLASRGFERASTRYLMFTPPRLRRLRRIDRILERLPMGAQYAVVARRPEE